MHHEDAIFVAGPDEEWKTEEIGEIPTDIKEAHEGDEHRQAQGEDADGEQRRANAAEIEQHENENQCEGVNGGMEERLMNRDGRVINIRCHAGDIGRGRYFVDGGFNGTFKCIEIDVVPEVFGGFNVES